MHTAACCALTVDRRSDWEAMFRVNVFGTIKRSVYFMRPLVPEHMLPIILFLSAQAGARPPVTGRLFHVPDWNYDHGYGDYRVWGDHDLPEDLERGYQQLEAVLPQLQRAGIARAPFDAERVAFGAAMARLALSSPSTAQADGR